MEHMKNEVRGIVKIGFGNDAISGVKNRFGLLRVTCIYQC